MVDAVNRQARERALAAIARANATLTQPRNHAGAGDKWAKNMPKAPDHAETRRTVLYATQDDIRAIKSTLAEFYPGLADAINRRLEFERSLWIARVDELERKISELEKGKFDGE